MEDTSFIVEISVRSFLATLRDAGDLDQDVIVDEVRPVLREWLAEETLPLPPDAKVEYATEAGRLLAGGLVDELIKRHPVS
jgi:hypothetical protein